MILLKLAPPQEPNGNTHFSRPLLLLTFAPPPADFLHRCTAERGDASCARCPNFYCLRFIVWSFYVLPRARRPRAVGANRLLWSIAGRIVRMQMQFELLLQFVHLLMINFELLRGVA